MAKPRLVWSHFCANLTTDATGKNSYISVFDRMTVNLRYRRGTPKPPIPLPQPVQTSPFVLAMHIQGEPDKVQKTELRIEDSDGQPIGPCMKGQIGKNPEGKNNLHIHLSAGLPVLRDGVYTFSLKVDGREAGCAELYIGLDIAEMGGAP